MIKACIFDLDGTVLYTVESIRASVSETLALQGYPPLTDAETAAFVGHGYRHLLRRALEKYGDTDEAHFEQACEDYPGIFRRRCTEGVVPYEGMPDVLRELKERGLKLAVFSNKGQEMAEACIYSVYGTGLFDLVTGEQEGVPIKPDPAALWLILKELDVSPAETMYFGDSPTDVQTAHAAGCVMTAVTWGYRSRERLEEQDPENIIDRPEEILQVMDLYSGGSRSFRYVIDGSAIGSRRDFFDQVNAQMTVPALTGFEAGRSLDAFADVLRGGFGRHGYGEPFELLWKNYGDSREVLGETFLLKVFEILLDADAEHECRCRIEF